MLTGQLRYLDYTAAFLFALTGALVAYEKDYDFTGLAAMALAVGVGGALIRDGIFLQQVPAVVQNPVYLGMIAAAIVIAVLIGDRIEKHLRIVILVADALGLGMYASVGASKSLAVGLTVYAAALIGIINATGGGMLRDVLSREEPVVFRPGQLYGIVAMVGVSVFLTLYRGFGTPSWVAAIVCISVTFVLRMVTVRFDLRTHKVKEHYLQTGVKDRARKLRGRHGESP